MVRTVYQSTFYVNNRVTGENTCLHCALNTCVNSRNIFLRNSTADNLILKYITFSSRKRFHIHNNMSVLTFTTRLTSIFMVNMYLVSYSLTVRYLRITYISFYLKLTQKSVNDNFKMKLTHTGNNCLTCLVISISSECRIFFSQFCKGNTHLFLSGFCLRLYRNTDNRFREFHRLKDNRSTLITKCVTCCSIL